MYGAVKKIEEIVKDPYHYKPLRHDLKNIRRVHIRKSFVLVTVQKDWHYRI
jgi:mRNA-degrading endonuclease RelE of RelBE toxin-antitoxin system